MGYFFIIAYIFIVILLFELYIRTTIYKISKFLIITKGNRIQQYISLESVIKQSIALNYYDNKPQNVDKIINDSFEKLKLFIQETDIPVLYTSTNSFMERKLRKLERENIIVIDKINTKHKRQIVERLFLMGAITSLKNLLNIEYWKYIFKDIKVSDFEITIVKNKKA